MLTPLLIFFKFISDIFPSSMIHESPKVTSSTFLFSIMARFKLLQLLFRHGSSKLSRYNLKSRTTLPFELTNHPTRYFKFCSHMTDPPDPKGSVAKIICGGVVSGN